VAPKNEHLRHFGYNIRKEHKSVAADQMMLQFPPHLNSASAVPGKINKHQNVIFLFTGLIDLLSRTQGDILSIFGPLFMFPFELFSCSEMHMLLFIKLAQVGLVLEH